MREVKEPEVRKQELMDCAMKLFAEKGYENTTISDIAKEQHVATGLCYHYFHSKKELYEEALKSYITLCTEDIIELFSKKLPLAVMEQEFYVAQKLIEQKSKYSDFFDRNKDFHIQLEEGMAEALTLPLGSYLEALNDRQEANIADPYFTASFILHGGMFLFRQEEGQRMADLKKMWDMIQKLIL